MEYVFLSLVITVFVVFMAYVRNPRFKASMNKTATIAKKRFLAWWYMQWHKRRLWQIDRVKKGHAAQLARMQKLIARDYKLSTNKDWKQGQQNNQPKGEKKENERKEEPSALATKRAWAEFLLYTVNWTELDCYPKVLNLLSAEAEHRAKDKGYNLELLRDKTAVVYDRNDSPIARINTLTGEIQDMRQAPKAPVVRQKEAKVFEADNRAPAPTEKKELVSPEIPPMPTWMLEEEARRA